MVLDVGREHLEAVDLAASAVPIAADAGSPDSATGARLRRSSSLAAAPRAQLLAQERPALRGRDRDRVHPLDAGDRRPGQAEQVHLHRDDDLALDQQVGLEGQRVERDVDRTLDGVLERDDAEVDVAVRRGVDHVDDRGELDELARGQIGLGEQGLLGERARRPQIADAHATRHALRNRRRRA